MPNFKFSKLKKPLMGAALLKTAPVLMGKGGTEECGGGKNQIGVNHLILEETPGSYATICTPKETETVPTCKKVSQWMPSDLIVAVNPLESSYIEIVFSVREMLASNKDRVLLLVYSQKLMPSPEIVTPKSINKFQLDINTLEVLGFYNIPAQSMSPQPSTRIGQANLATSSIVLIRVELDTLALSNMMNKRERIYLQAALLPRSDFDAGNFEQNMILSEVDVISFVKMECPENYASTDYDEDIGKTVTAAETSSTISFGPDKGGE